MTPNTQISAPVGDTVVRQVFKSHITLVTRLQITELSCQLETPFGHDPGRQRGIPIRGNVPVPRHHQFQAPLTGHSIGRGQETGLAAVIQGEVHPGGIQDGGIQVLHPHLAGRTQTGGVVQVEFFRFQYPVRGFQGASRVAGLFQLVAVLPLEMEDLCLTPGRQGLHAGCLGFGMHFETDPFHSPEALRQLELQALGLHLVSALDEDYMAFGLGQVGGLLVMQPIRFHAFPLVVHYHAAAGLDIPVLMALDQVGLEEGGAFQGLVLGVSCGQFAIGAQLHIPGTGKGYLTRRGHPQGNQQTREGRLGGHHGGGHEGVIRSARFLTARIIALERLERLTAWTREVVRQELSADLIRLEPASADASFRRYFRAFTAHGSHIVMDAPPSHEDCRPWLHVGRLFRAAGANTPAILAENLAEGFLLISDLGNTTYLSVLEDSNADRLYRDANTALINIQLASREGELPPYDEALLRRELDLFPDWYLTRHLGVALSKDQRQTMEDTFRRILDNNLAQPKVYVHRDWHSRNLMVSEPDNPGVIDFQDAVYGPITYDLASIYKDAYIRWEEERILDWSVRYWEGARKTGLPVHGDFGDFYRDFEWMGVQRHIKVLGIFARLYHRDGKDGYLKDMPLVMHYLRKACERYNGLGDFLRLLDQVEGKAAEVGYTF